MSATGTAPAPSPAPRGLSRAELANLSAAVAGGTPAQLERIVAMLDSLAERGEADRVLDAARARLRSLRPSRPLPLTRLLFVPLDGAIVPPGGWRPADPAVPRNALVPLAALVTAHMQDQGAGLNAALVGLRRSDDDAVARLGPPLWTEASGILAATAARAPAGWVAAGLREEDFGPVATLCSAVLAHGAALHAAAREVAQGPPGLKARSVLQALLLAGRNPFAAGLAALLATAARPGAVSALAAILSPAMAGQIEGRLASAVEDRLETLRHLPVGALPEEVDELQQILDDAAAMSARGPAWRRQLDGWRQAAEAACRAGYVASAERQVLRPAERLADGGASDAEVEGLERNALALRCLDVAARPLGNGGTCEAARRDMLRGLQRLARAAEPMARVELARLAELLGGPEAGMAVLEPGAG